MKKECAQQTQKHRQPSFFQNEGDRGWCEEVRADGSYLFLLLFEACRAPRSECVFAAPLLQQAFQKSLARKREKLQPQS